MQIGLKHKLLIYSLGFLLGMSFNSISAAQTTPAVLRPIQVEELAVPSRVPIKAEARQTISHQEKIANPQVKKKQPQTSSLSFSWNMPVSLAVFKRENQLWIVFDHPQTLNIEELRAAAGNLAQDIFQFPHPGATIVRLTPRSDVEFSVRKEGLLWIVDLFTEQNATPIKEIPVYTQYDSLKRPYLFIPTDTAGNIVAAIDPDVGDIITIAPIANVGSGILKSYHYPEFDMLGTSQGLAFVIKSQDITLNRGNTGVTIRSPNRGLNISEDLDMKKRQEQIKNDSGSYEDFDIRVSPQLLKLDYSTAIDQLRQDIIAADPNQKDKARLELVKYFIAKGLGTNALYILHQMQNAKLPETQTDKFHALLGVANFLTRRYQEAEKEFEYGRLPEINEAIFWRTLASSAIGYKPENNIILLSFISLIRDYPQEIKDEIAVIAAKNALAANDDIAAQNFIDILKSAPVRLKNRDDQIRYLSAKKLELLGYPRNAIKEYRELATSPSAKYSTLARYDNAVLSQRINAMPTPNAINELERLKYAWSEKEFKWLLLNKLAELYVKNGDYYNGIRVLQSAMPLASAPQKQQLTNKMVGWFEDIYLNNQADAKMPAVKSLALYKDFEWLADLSARQNEIIQKLADRLVAVDLLPRAQKLLTSLLQKNSLSAQERAKTGARLAVIYLFENKPDDALNTIDQTFSTDLPYALSAHRRVIKARSLANIGRTDEALELLAEDYSKNATLLKTEIFWNARQWDQASDTIKFLIEKPIPGKELSEEQIGYILDWATALKKAGKETVLVRLRNKFLPYFAKTKYHSVFNILTEHLEADKIDIREINNIVNDAQAFSNFAKVYNDSLKNTEIK